MYISSVYRKNNKKKILMGIYRYYNDSTINNVNYRIYNIWSYYASFTLPIWYHEFCICNIKW